MTNHCRMLHTIIGTALTSLAATAAVQAQEPATKPAAAQLPVQGMHAGADGLPQAAVRSGASVDRQAQFENKLTRMTDQSSTGLVAVKLPDGSTRVNLQGRFMHVAVATPTDDGGHEISCDAGNAALEKANHAQQVGAGVLPKPKRAAHAAPQTVPAVTEDK